METIATFDSPEAAHLLRMRLEDVGFEAVVLDDSVLRLNPFYSDTKGGVRVQVREEDVEEVREFLKADDQPRDDLIGHAGGTE